MYKLFSFVVNLFFLFSIKCVNYYFVFFGDPSHTILLADDSNQHDVILKMDRKFQDHSAHSRPEGFDPMVFFMQR